MSMKVSPTLFRRSTDFINLAEQLEADVEQLASKNKLPSKPKLRGGATVNRATASRTKSRSSKISATP